MSDNAEQFGEKIELGIDPGRLVFGLSRIGYTPSSAISDILDNSVSANAKNINVLIVKEDPNSRDTKENNVKEYVVIDDGNGMDEEGMKEALKLGAKEDGYEPETLSKFGLGLKSASFSQGEELHLISSNGSSHFVKYVLAMSDIGASYFARKVPLDENDEGLVKTFIPGGCGTIVRIAKVRKTNHPSVKNTLEDLLYKLGVVYFYFIKDNGLNIYIHHGGEKTYIEAIDVLFLNEVTGNLNEHEWDGNSVKWIQQPQSVTLDSQGNVQATIEVTQLPYPPLFELDERGGAAKIRKQYRIEAGNYGYYVYRNKRLIAWAEGFSTKNGTIIPQDQSYYAFRGRILLSDSADDIFNIDVKKSDIVLSNEAWLALDDISLEFKSKSKKAWEHAKQLAKEKRGQDPNVTANNIISDFEPPQVLPGEFLSPKEEEERKGREEELEKEMRSKFLKKAATQKSEKIGEAVSEEEIGEEELEVAIKGDANPSATKIFRVQSIDDNVLWEPYHDAEHGTCVRINKGHRFAKVLFEENRENIDLQVMMELYLLQMAEAEIYALKSNQEDRKTTTKILAEYRRVASEILAAMCRKLEGKLPPLKDDVGL